MVEVLIIPHKLCGIRTRDAHLSDGNGWFKVRQDWSDYVCGYAKPHYPVPAPIYKVEWGQGAYIQVVNWYQGPWSHWGFSGNYQFRPDW